LPGLAGQDWIDQNTHLTENAAERVMEHNLSGQRSSALFPVQQEQTLGLGQRQWIATSPSGCCGLAGNQRALVWKFSMAHDKTPGTVKEKVWWNDVLTMEILFWSCC
jgi:hypothetical protein